MNCKHPLYRLLLLGVLIPASASVAGDEGRITAPPAVDAGLDARHQAQREGRGRLKVFHDFRFTDQRRASSVLFHHRPPDQALRARRGLAWERGSSVAAADVDGDGHADLYFVSPEGGNQLWRNRGDGTFEDVTATAHVGLGDRLATTAAFADLDNDGDPDLVVSTDTGPVLLANLGQGAFVDRTEEAGLAAAPTAAAVVFDYQPDGRLDLLLLPAGTRGRTRLYRQEAPLRFTAVFGPELQFLYRAVRDAVAADVDGDGDLDLVVVNSYGRGVCWANGGDGSFADQTAQLFPSTPGDLTGLRFFDGDGDGRPEVLFHGAAGSVLHAGLSGGPTPVDGVAPAWGSSAGDLNADGWTDLFIPAGRGHPFPYAVNAVLVNNAGRGLVAAEFLLGVEPRRELTVAWTELDCSGADQEHEHCAEREGPVVLMGARASRCAVVFDLEGDGDLDVVTNEVNAEPQVLVSDLAARREVRFLKVRLVGTSSSRDGLGAVVTVRTDAVTRTLIHDGRSGHLTYSSLPLYFGLAGSEKILSLEVRWPSGVHQTVPAPIGLNTLLKVEESAPSGCP